MTTIRKLLLARADETNVALRFENQSWTYREFVAACAQRAAYLLGNRREGPFHLGILLENVPEYPLWLGAAALAGATVVGINPTRQGCELARDIAHTDCQFIITENSYQPLLDGLDGLESLGLEQGRILNIDHKATSDALRVWSGADIPEVEVDEQSTYLLVFTSGTSGAPKACICSQGRLAYNGCTLAQMLSFTAAEVCYCVMPLFHSNALMANWVPALAAGATCVLRRKFSASGFLPDVRHYGVTFFNYVGKPLAYVLATPEQVDDADNPLRIAFGNEATEQDIARFARRFNCSVMDAYGSTEGGVNVGRTPDMPRGALGKGLPGVLVLNAESAEPCPRARFGDRGELLNPDEAIGELANIDGASTFEGYWKNDDASAERVRGGIYWTGDLAYMDDNDFIYFAGRDSEWLRVDGENFAAAPVERILSRFDGVSLAAVYAVPDEIVGDQVMAALQLDPDYRFDPGSFADFLESQTDLGTKWAPRYVRLCETLPVTPTNKILKRSLRGEHWECADPVWRRVGNSARYELLQKETVAAIRQTFRDCGRESLLDLM
jgi:fatty-acyl-CoA synthase